MPVFAQRLLRDARVAVLKGEEKTQRAVSNYHYTYASPEPIKNPKLVVASLPALALVGLDDASVDVLCGNSLLDGSRPLAHNYCGFQFGAFSGQLGDGATMTLGEISNRDGATYELQLKGGGKTPFSRTADGRKVLRSSLREFLCSEAMHGLGIPTTRAGSVVVSTETTVVRDVLYDGNPKREPCAVITRVAETFIRFGSFEIARGVDPYTGRSGTSSETAVSDLASYVHETFYSSFNSKDDMFAEIVRRTASLAASWNAVGFCHGVLNTDNMSIVGLTLDYGPFGFVEGFDPNHVCNRSDDSGRYAFSKQPAMTKWNCLKLGEAFVDCGVLESKENVQTIVNSIFDETYALKYKESWRRKLGLHTHDDELTSLLLMNVMAPLRLDFTRVFTVLTLMASNERKDVESDVEDFIAELFPDFKRYAQTKSTDDERVGRIPHHVMKLIANQVELGNRDLLLAQTGLSDEQLDEQLRLFRRDDSTTDEDRRVEFERTVRDARNHLSEFFMKWKPVEVDQMKRVNPRFVLRNSVAQLAIDAASRGDFSVARRVLECCENPYDDSIPDSFLLPSDEIPKPVSCSS